jgi:hypothetical protein
MWNRELATYPEGDARRMHLLLVVLITVTLYYELYVGSGVATIMLAQLKIPFPIFVYILAADHWVPGANNAFAASATNGELKTMSR